MMPLSKYKAVSAEVFQAEGPVSAFDAKMIDALAQAARVAPRKRCRICFHPSNSDLLHEMLIALSRETYVRPHRHHGKSESFHMIKGALTVLIFNESGEITQSIDLDEPGTGGTFYYRLSAPLYHMVIPRSDVVVFHETTNGPFSPDSTDFADWSPVEGSEDVPEFIKKIVLEV